MNRRYRIILTASALASTLAVAPCLWAQTGASTDAGSATMKEEMSDTAINSKVTSALNEDKDTSPLASAIQVQTNGGVVTLSGNVPSKEAAEHTQMVVARLSGVRDIVNDLKYPQSASSSENAPAVVPPQAGAANSANPDASTNMANTANNPNSANNPPANQ